MAWGRRQSRAACVLGVALFLLGRADPAQAAFAYRRLITVDGTRVAGPGNLLDFPVLVSVQHPDLRTAPAGHVQSASGYDIAFMASTGGAILNHEIERYNGATGTLVAWVRIPTLNGNPTNTTFYMYYGDPDITCPQNNPVNVWANYRYVYHFNQSGAANPADSTVNNVSAVRNPTADGAIGNAYASAIVGGGLDLVSAPVCPGGGCPPLLVAGTPTHVRINDAALGANPSYTIEGWFFLRIVDPDDYTGVLTKNRDGGVNDWVGLWKNNDDLVPPPPDNVVTLSNNTGGDVHGTTSVVSGRWYYGAVSASDAADRRRVFLYDTMETEDAATVFTTTNVTLPARVGDDSNGSWLDGLVDELRFSDVERSPEWIQTTARNQGCPSGSASAPACTAPLPITTPFLSLGAEQAPPTNYRSIGAPGAYAGGTVSASIGSPVVTGSSTNWIAANRGRGDLITFGGNTYTVRSLDSQTQITLHTASLTNEAGSPYSMARMFTSLTTWEDCIDGPPGGGCPAGSPPAPNPSLVTDDRREVGVVFRDGSNYAQLTFIGAATGPFHDITLTADPGNRHHGVAGAGVTIVNATASPGIWMNSGGMGFLTIEWMEVTGGGAGAVGIHLNNTTLSNRFVVRNNVVHDVPSHGIQDSDTDHKVQIYDNVVYNTGGIGIALTSIALHPAQSNIRILNNTVYNPALDGISSATNPSVTLTVTNNISWGSPSADFNVPGVGSASNNLSSDLSAPGLGSLTLRPLTGVGGVNFISTVGGAENLHLTTGTSPASVASGAGTNLGCFLQRDIDNVARLDPWEIGADEIGLPGGCPGLVTSSTASTITVETPAVRMVWDAGAGGGLSELYGKTETNSSVSRRGDGVYNVFSTQLHDGAWHFEGGGAGNVHLLEATATRVRVRQNYDYTAQVHLDRDWSIYAHPRLAIDEDLVFDFDQLNLRGAQGLHPKGEAVCGGANTFFCAGQSIEASRIWLATDNGPGYSDVLAIANTTPFFARGGATYSWNNMLEAGTPNTWLARVHESSAPFTTVAGTYNRRYLVYPYLAGLTSGGTEWQPYANDYRSPDALSFNAPMGTGWEDANENTGPGDFFNEAEAAYAVDINPTSGLSMNIDGNATSHPRPFFKIRQWRSLLDPLTLTREGTPFVSGVDFQADVKPVARAYFCVPGCTQIAHGGLLGHVNEYLADASGPRNYTMNFTGLNYLYLGADVKFRGLNVGLATAGAGTADLLWEYWNGAWVSLEAITGFTDQTNSFKQNGAIYWGSDSPETDPAGWTATSVNGSPLLFYVRARLNSGSYTTQPVEAMIKTDVLLFQYCGNVLALDETFVFAPPAPTAVALSSFTASGLDGGVELGWTTASELQNLGFHLYRADSAGGPYARITSSLIPGLGSSPTGQSYSYRDGGLMSGRRYFYLLEDVETTGRTERHGPVSVMVGSAAGPCCSSTPPGPTDGVGGSYGDPSRVVLREVERSGRHVVLELETGGFLASPAEEGRVSLRIPGFESASRPGEPSLPMRRTFVEAASGKKVRLTSVFASDDVRFPGLRPVSQGMPGIEVSEEGVVLPSEEKRPDGPGFGRLFPEASALLLGTSFQGESKKAEVLLFPLRWDGSGLTLSRRLRVRLEFSGTERKETSRGGSRGRRSVERPSHARSGVLAQIAVKERGLYRVDYEELFDTAPQRQRRRISAASLRLSRQGESVVFHVEPAGALFGPGSSLYFLSEGSALNPYADAVYELETNANGVLMEEGMLSSSTSRGVGEYLETVRKEENHYYQAALLEAPDLWLWDIVVSPASKAFAFTTDQVAASSRAGRLTVVLQGVSDFPGVMDHHVKVRVNGVFVGETTWDGARARTLEMEVPAGAFLEGGNSVSLENVGDTGASYSMVFLNGFSVSYPRQLVAVQGTLEGRFETSGPAEIEGALPSSFVLETTGIPRWLVGASPGPSGLSVSVEAGKSYLVTSSVLRPVVKRLSPSGLKSPSNQADYLLLGPQAFLSAAQPLLDLRQSQGLVTKAISLEEVYEQFGHGEVSPEAIKEFLEYAYHFWSSPSPRYVLLLGDASYDPKNYLGTGVKDWLPGFPVRTSYLWTVSDPAYASVNGDDLLPDIAMGRLPAGSLDEALRMVEKTLSYENGGGRLDGPAVLVADNADQAGNFEANADDIAATVLAPRNPKKIYYSLEGANTRTKIHEAFNDGASLLSYIGHGSTVGWASENFFNYQDVPLLAPQPQQPLLLTLNCLNGFFHFPPLNSLSEALLKPEDKGVVAAFSPSGLSVNDPAHIFHKALLEEIVSVRHERIGDAVLAAQQAYAQTGAFPELLSIYHLFGDPALRIQ